MTLRTGNSGSNPAAAARRRAFTLVELLLVMTLLIVVISMGAPKLAAFFRGRTLDVESRRLLALTHQGQSRAVSEGQPIVLWLNAQSRTYGLAAEPSYETYDDKAVEFPLDKDLQMDMVRASVNVRASGSRPGGISGQTAQGGQHSSAARNTATTPFSNLPQIRFLPDGSFDENSLQAVSLRDRDGTMRWLELARNGLNYEIRNQLDPANGVHP